MRKRVGYFDGTDAAVLTALICEGHDTLPIGNGLDNHGQHARLINDQNRYDLLLAPLHKIYAPVDAESDTVAYQDVFRISRTYSIPLLISVDRSLHDTARALLEDPPESVQLVDPADLLDVASRILAETP